MKALSIFALLLIASTSFAQITLTGSYPANGATNVPTNMVISLAFSGALYTSPPLTNDAGLITNVDQPSGMWYSPSGDTVYYQVSLQPARDYFVLIYYVNGVGGAKLSTPYCLQFTTASSFSGHSVSGTVSGGITGINPAHSIIVFSSTPFNQQPTWAAGGLADGSGIFTATHVPDGTLYPAAAKDLNQDGAINPGKGDAVAFGNSFTMSGSDYAGLVLTYSTYTPMTFAAANDTIAARGPSILPGDAVLKRVGAWETDSLARGEWNYIYYSPSQDRCFEMTVDPQGMRTQQGPSSQYSWMMQMKPLPSTAGAGDPAVFVGNCEANGGLTFRSQSMPDSLFFKRDLTLGHLTYSDFYWYVPDTSQYYWGARYSWAHQVTQDSTHDVLSKYFIGDFSTGQILVVSSVDAGKGKVPGSYVLHQNYPNPFNPSTTIEYGLPAQSHVMLEVFNILGQRVATLANDIQTAGTYHVEWHPAMSSGIYFYKLTAVPVGQSSKAFSEIRKMTYIR